MKLLNSTTLEIEEFFGSAIPKSYVILSHRWERGEATYQDVGDERAMWQKPGWAKIRKTCSIARDRGIGYVWVDTCCINKQDFSELTEAINSMFKWYADATVCFAYLSDVDKSHPIEWSRWFSRGWTLQELIAPDRVEFFDRTWNAIGTREERSVAIRVLTGIDESILRGRSRTTRTGFREQLDDFPIAVRMSWAAGRETTRVEDRAYSLMGLFNVNMPLLYGEGDRAFVRLQEEIIKESNDMTLFAWTVSTRLDQLYHLDRGILASSPENFGSLRNTTSTLAFTRRPASNPEFMVTNKGLRISAETFGFSASYRAILDPGSFQILPLGCCWLQHAPGSELGILLQSNGDGIWLRAEVHKLLEVPSEPARGPTTFFIRKHGPPTRSHLPDEIRFELPSPVARIARAVPVGRWIEKETRFRTAGLHRFTGFIQVCWFDYRGWPGTSFVIICGLDSAAGQKLQFWSALEGSREGIYEAAMVGDLDEIRMFCVNEGRASGSKMELPEQLKAHIERSYVGGKLVVTCSITE